MAQYLPGTTETLHTHLTQLLMDNGAAVTKKSVDALIEFIAVRDQEIINKVIQDAERTLSEAQRQTRD